MSMPSINIVCEKCDFTGSSMTTWGRFSYLIDGLEVPLDRELGWCFDCKSFKPIEYLSSEGIMDEIEKFRSELEDMPSNWLLRLIPFVRREIKHYRSEIKKQELLLNLIEQRKGTEKCLNCSSTNVKYFDGDYSLEYNGFMFEGEKRTGFIHPECGGEFIATPCGLRFHMKFDTQYYDFDGFKTDKE